MATTKSPDKSKLPSLIFDTFKLGKNCRARSIVCATSARLGTTSKVFQPKRAATSATKAKIKTVFPAPVGWMQSRRRGNSCDDLLLEFLVSAAYFAYSSKTQRASVWYSRSSSFINKKSRKFVLERFPATREISRLYLLFDWRGKKSRASDIRRLAGVLADNDNAVV